MAEIMSKRWGCITPAPKRLLTLLGRFTVQHTKLAQNNVGAIALYTVFAGVLVGAQATLHHQQTPLPEKGRHYLGNEVALETGNAAPFGAFLAITVLVEKNLVTRSGQLIDCAIHPAGTDGTRLIERRWWMLAFSANDNQWTASIQAGFHCFKWRLAICVELGLKRPNETILPGLYGRVAVLETT